MTAIGNESWKYSWTPTATGTFLIKFTDPAIDVSYYLYANVVGTVIGVPSGSVGGSALSTLRKDFLIQIDSYNADDLTGDASSGDLANKSINKALQKIYSMCKDTKFMEAYPVTTLAATANQDYIDLGAVTDMDEIESIVDSVNMYPLIKIPYWKYKLWSPDPASVTGIPTNYARLFNRIYLYPRPTQIWTYTTTYVKAYPELVADSDASLLPSKYNYWIYAEAEVEWYKMQDPNAIPTIVLTERQEAREIALKDIFSNFDEDYQAETNFGRDQIRRRSLYTPF